MHIKLLNIGFVKKGDYYVNNEFEMTVRIVDEETVAVITDTGEQMATLDELEKALGDML